MWHILVCAVGAILISKIQAGDHKGSEKNAIAHDQLSAWKDNHEIGSRAVNSHGIPLPSLTASLSVGDKGPLLIQDSALLHHLAKFDRERIPERVVHAKGAGAYGYFEATEDITHWTKLKPFEKVGKQTRIAIRFSTVGGELGSADTVRDPRGFAIKFYTEDGNWDIVGNNIPIFFIRDPIKFPSFVHTQKKNPTTNLKDANMFWDFISMSPETTHQVTFLFSDRGIPDCFRHMHGFGSHTFKLINSTGQAVYAKFHYKTDQKIKNIVVEEAMKIAGENPDYCIQDLYDAIARKDFPSWTVYLQIMTFEQAETYKYNPFDLTKVWLHGDFPLKKVGKFILNENQANYFAEIEQIAFGPSNMIPGIEASPDKMLQGRMFSYVDTHRHRIGANYEQLPVNRPDPKFVDAKQTYNRDGPMNIIGKEYGGSPNYFPNSFSGPTIDPRAAESVFKSCGDVVRYDTGGEDNFSQTKIFWERVLQPDEKQRLVDNMAHHLVNADKIIQQRAVKNFRDAHEEYGKMLEEALAKSQMTKFGNNFY